jgi:hypothetical protein
MVTCCWPPRSKGTPLPFPLIAVGVLALCAQDPVEPLDVAVSVALNIGWDRFEKLVLAIGLVADGAEPFLLLAVSQRWLASEMLMTTLPRA